MIVNDERRDQSAEQWMLWSILDQSGRVEDVLWPVRDACPHLMLGWPVMQRALRDNQ